MEAATRDQRNPVTVQQPSDRELVVTRAFDAPAHLVFRAWTAPELFRQWWVPKSLGMALESLEMDARTGGSYRLDFGNGAVFFGTYLEVTPSSRLVWTNEEGGQSASTTTVTLEDRGETTVVTVSELFVSKEAFEAGAGASEALEQTFGQLDDLLGELAAAG